MWPNSKTSFFEQWCAVLQISNKFWKMHVRSSTVQDSNTDNNRAVRETVEKRYSQDKLCMGFQNFLEQLLFRFKDRKRTIRTIPNSEAVIRRCSVKIVFLEISQNSQENACARASFLKESVNFSKFLRTPFVTEQLRWLLLNISFSITIWKNSVKVKKTLN